MNTQHKIALVCSLAALSWVAFCDGPVSHVCVADQAAPMSTDTNHWWWKAHEYRVNEVKAAKCAPDVVFLGDSIFHYWEIKENAFEWERFFSGRADARFHALNLAIEGDRTETLLWRLQNGLLVDGGKLPRVAVLLIGTNNTGTRNIEREPPEDTVKGVKAILDYSRRVTHGATKFIVYGLLPRGSGTNDTCTVRNMKVNEGIRKLCDGRDIFYRDIGDKFLNADGTINTALLHDKLHPSAAGYNIILGDLLPALVEFFPGDREMPRN